MAVNEEALRPEYRSDKQVDTCGNWELELQLGDIEDVRLRIKGAEIIRKHEKMWSGELGQIRGTEHRIQLNSSTVPFRQTTYRQEAAMRQKITDQIQEQMDAGVI